MNYFLLAIVFYAALADMNEARIPNRAIIFMLLLGVFQQIPGWPLSYPVPSMSGALIGLVSMLVAGFILYRIGFFGAGDAKLFATIGWVVGTGEAVSIFLYAFIFLVLMSLGRLVATHSLIDRLKMWRDIVICRTSIRKLPAGEQLLAVPMGGAILLAVAMHQFY